VTYPVSGLFCLTSGWEHLAVKVVGLFAHGGACSFAPRTAALQQKTGMAIAIALAALSTDAQSQSTPFVRMAGSEAYIQQSRGRVNPGASILTKPPPEAATGASPSATPTAPVTCNAQNASSQACYTATQQSKPAGR
jgi:hypothetical protein